MYVLGNNITLLYNNLRRTFEVRELEAEVSPRGEVNAVLYGSGKSSLKRRSKWRHLKRREGRNFIPQMLRYVPLLSLLLRLIELLLKRLG